MTTRARLLELGYRISFRQDAWWECRISSSAHGEDWLGRGDDEAAAFASALAKLLPSHAARSAFGAVPAASSDDEHTLFDAPPPSSEALTLERPIAEVTREFTILGDDDATRPPSTEGDVLRDLEELRARIVAVEPDIAVMPPARQRLQLLRFAAEVRGLAELAAGSREVATTEAAAIAVLGRMARAYWPGSVRALVHNTTPRECAEELSSEAPANWRAVATLAARAVEAAPGWSDDDRLVPAPPDPAPMLEAIARTTAQSAHAIERGADSAALVETLTDATRRLRWLRKSAPDRRLWGAAIGSVRRAIAHHPSGLAPVAELVDPGYCPARPWALEIAATR